MLHEEKRTSKRLREAIELLEFLPIKKTNKMATAKKPSFLRFLVFLSSHTIKVRVFTNVDEFCNQFSVIEY